MPQTFSLVFWWVYFQFQWIGFAFEGGVKPEDLMKCIVSTPSETTAYLVEAVNALEKEHAYHTIGGLKMLGLGLK